MSSDSVKASYSFYHLDQFGHVAEIGLKQLGALRDTSANMESDRIHDRHLDRIAAAGFHPLMADKAVGGGLLLKAMPTDALRISDELFGIPSARANVTPFVPAKINAPGISMSFGSAANGDIRLPRNFLPSNFASAVTSANAPSAAPRLQELIAA